MIRISSIDVFRALTMVLMLWVNDFWTLRGIPRWLEHSPADVDFLGFSDIIFPCFLFIVGMSIPFAIKNRLAKGHGKFEISRHILTRSLALLIMGLFTVNVPEINAEATGMSSTVYKILMITGFFLIWNSYPKVEDEKKYLFVFLQALGVVLLTYLALIFNSGGSGGELAGFEPRWWGILGLIGWAYLGAALIYLFTDGNIRLVFMGWLIFTLFNIAGHAGWLLTISMHFGMDSDEWFAGNGAFHSFALAGTLCAMLLEKYYQKDVQKLIGLFLGLAILFFFAGIFARQFFIISKIWATPTWIFLCCAIAFAVYAFLHWLVDIKGKVHWFDPIKPAGSSTLTCYLIPYWYYSFVALAGISLPAFFTTGIIGLLKSMVYSFIIVGLTAVVGKLGIRLKI